MDTYIPSTLMTVFLIIITTIDMTAQVTMVTNITINILVTDFHWVLLTRMYQQCCTLSIGPALLLLIPSLL